MEVNFFDQAFIDDPFPALRAVRAMGPAVYNPLSDSYLVTGYRDIEAAFKDARTFSSTVLEDPDFGPWFDGAKSMITSDAPDAARLRSTLQARFTNRAAGKLENSIRGYVAAILENPILHSREARVEGVNAVDVITERLPTLVLCDLLGIPERDVPYFAELTEALINGTSAGTTSDPRATRLFAKAIQARDRLRDYIEALVADYRKHPRDDVVNDMIKARDDDKISSAEIVANMLVLLLGGVDTTAKLSASLIWLLGMHPDQRQLLLADPTLQRAAVEEALRCAGPASYDPRRVIDGATVGGQELHDGDVVWLLTLVGNRDPQVFANPDEFDVRRTPGPHPAGGTAIEVSALRSRHSGVGPGVLRARH